MIYVTTKPFLSITGLCIKAYKSDESGKLFINLCQTPDILAPRALTESELMEILESERPDAFKIPMSISECYDVKDKAGNKATACDIAINEKFFQKILQSPLFSNFLTALMFEAIDDKYKIKCVEDSWTVLKNLKAMTNGALKSHRIENRDNEQVRQYYNDGGAGAGQEKPKSLIQEIDDSDAQLLRGKGSQVKETPSKYVPDPLKVKISEANYKKPDYRLIQLKDENDQVYQLVGEFHLPDVVSASEIVLDVGPDRVVVEARKKNYLIEGFLIENEINTELVNSEFDTRRNVLTVNIPIVQSN